MQQRARNCLILDVLAGDSYMNCEIPPGCDRSDWSPMRLSMASPIAAASLVMSDFLAEFSTSLP